MGDDSVAVGKTIREIADEIGVTKQAVFKKINRQPLSTKLMELTSTVDGRLMVSVDGEILIKQAFLCKNTDETLKTVDKNDKVLSTEPSTVNQVDDNQSVNRQPKPSTVDGAVDGSMGDEIVFLRNQVAQMNEQLRRKDDFIDSLNRELEKEREHNRDKDRQLMGTLSKLAETQAALAVGQSAEKQKALAETLIEGQQKMDSYSESAESEDEGELDREIPAPKMSWLRQVWSAFTRK